MKKKSESSDRLFFGRHVDFIFTKPVGTREAAKQSKRVDEKVKKYEEEK